MINDVEYRLIQLTFDNSDEDKNKQTIPYHYLGKYSIISIIKIKLIIRW